MTGVRVKIPVNRFLVVVAEGDGDHGQVGAFLDLRKDMWEKDATGFAFYCRDWLVSRGYKAKVVAEESLGFLPRCLLTMMLLFEDWRTRR